MRRALLATTPTAALFSGGTLSMPATTVPMAIAASLPAAPALAAEVRELAPPFAEPESDPVEASYYGEEFAGRPTASGETFDPKLLTAAHRTYPLGSLVQVTDAGSGLSVVVKVNDRGPFHGDRAIDLSTAAARKIGLDVEGVGQVTLRLLATS